MRRIPTLTLAAIATLYLAGCATIRENPVGIREVHLREDAISMSKIELPETPEPHSIDDLIWTADSLLDYIKFKKDYQPMIQSIYDNIRSNNFDEADSIVHNLAIKLEEDERVYAHFLLDEVKIFSYVVEEVYDLEKTTTWKEPKPKEMTAAILGSPIIGLIGGIGVVIDTVAAPFGVGMNVDGSKGEPFCGTKDFFGRVDELCWEEKSRTERVGQKIVRTKVTPYYNRREELKR